MTLIQDRDREISDLIEASEGVLGTQSILARLTKAELRWRLRTGHWQRPYKGIVITQSGPLTDGQVLRIAVGWAGPGAALAGLTAARLEGFTGFGDRARYADGPIHLLVPRGWKRREPVAGLELVTRYSRALVEDVDIHPARDPRRTRIERSLIDAAAWAPSDRRAVAIVAAGVQQRRVRIPGLEAALERQPQLRRHRLIAASLADIGGGAEALSELDFLTKVVRPYRLPEPQAQVPRRDKSGRRRYIDVIWEKQRVVVEIDGAQHAEPLQRWDDYERDIDLQIDGYRVLRFPAWLVRTRPDLVAAKLHQVLTARP